MIVDRELKSP
jgi:hypothetical protein